MVAPLSTGSPATTVPMVGRARECCSGRKRVQRRNDHRAIGNSLRVCLNLNKQVLTIGPQVTNLESR